MFVLRALDELRRRDRIAHQHVDIEKNRVMPVERAAAE
jgi:hypothetical protein